MFTNMLGPVMDKYLNHYKMDVEINSPIRGQELVWDQFTIDYRNTHDPIHEEESVTFLFMGEMFYQNKGCKQFAPIDMPRLEIKETYISVSPAAANCIAEQLAKTKLGKFEMKKSNLDKLFNDGRNHELTTTSLKDKIPIFEQKLGKDKPLNFVLSYKDMDITFARKVKAGDYNIRLKFKLLMSVYYDYLGEHLHMNLPKDELMYDEL